MSFSTTDSGAHINAEPLTTQLTAQASPDLLTNAVDQRIVRVRPMSTPIDQITRWAGARHAGAMVVDYYAVDTKPTSAAVTTAIAAASVRPSSLGIYTLQLQVDIDDFAEVSDTILLPGAIVQGKPLMLYVATKTNAKSYECTVVNPGPNSAPIVDINVGDTVVRMGRAAAELDVQTAQYEALPVKRSNNCQIFKMQVEQSTFQKIANKEVGWTFSDQEESAIIDMRLAMEKSFLFGAQGKVYDANKHDNILFTGGIWTQADNEVYYDASDMSAAALVNICRQAFTNNGGSTRKLLIAGSELIESLSTIEYNKVVQAGQTRVQWGLELNEIRSQFGSLYVVHSEIFDQCGHAADGFILDPEYLTKFVHVPFRAEKLDLRSAGTRNTDAVVMTEASCLVLRYPKAHARLLKL